MTIAGTRITHSRQWIAIGELVAAIAAFTPQLRTEAGCPQLPPHRSTVHADRLSVVEVHADATAFEQQLAAEHVRGFVRRLDDAASDGRTAAGRTIPLPHDLAGARA